MSPNAVDLRTAHLLYTLSPEDVKGSNFENFAYRHITWQCAIIMTMLKPPQIPICDHGRAIGQQCADTPIINDSDPSDTKPMLKP